MNCACVHADRQTSLPPALPDVQQERGAGELAVALDRPAHGAQAAFASQVVGPRLDLVIGHRPRRQVRAVAALDLAVHRAAAGPRGRRRGTSRSVTRGPDERRCRHDPIVDAPASGRARLLTSRRLTSRAGRRSLARRARRPGSAPRCRPARTPPCPPAARSGQRSVGMTSPTATANARAEAEWPGRERRRRRHRHPASLRHRVACRGRVGAVTGQLHRLVHDERGRPDGQRPPSRRAPPGRPRRPRGRPPVEPRLEWFAKCDAGAAARRGRRDSRATTDVRGPVVAAQPVKQPRGVPGERVPLGGPLVEPAGEPLLDRLDRCDRARTAAVSLIRPPTGRPEGGLPQRPQRLPDATCTAAAASWRESTAPWPPHGQARPAGSRSAAASPW